MATSEYTSPEITKAQLAEVKHRIAEVESSEVELILGDEVSAGVRRLLEARLADMEAHPDDQSLWPEVKARLELLDEDELSRRSGAIPKLRVIPTTE